jgi:tripartite-type tricarboxylate transporter receptor subunit TctC
MIPVCKRLLVALAAALFSGYVFAQAYPVKPVRLVVPFPAGGSTDVLARVISLKASDNLGQRIIIDNRPGAGGTIGSEMVAKAAPDG